MWDACRDGLVLGQVNRHDVLVMGEVGRIMVERPYADWLSVRFCSSSSTLTTPSSPSETEGWLLERENREKRMPPMPFPMLAAPVVVEGDTKRDTLGRVSFQSKTPIMVGRLFFISVFIS